ncbi:MAG: CAP domain-containing protein, partial [Acidimicrobiia bacterium]
AMSITAHYLSKVMSLPGLNLINRVGGALVAVAWGIAIVLVVVNLARILPGGEDRFEGSTVADAIAGPDALPQRAFSALVADEILQPLASIQRLFGANRAVPEGDEALEIPPAAPDEVRQVRDEAAGVLDQINEYRAGRGLAALDGSESLAGVAETRAVEMYTTGRISRDHPPGGHVGDDVAAAGIRLARVGENLALASSSRAAFDAMLDSPTALTHLDTPTYDRAGVAVVDGPTGHLVVIVFGA